MNDEQRKAFEEWADDKYVLHKDHDGDYMYTGAKCAFEAWQVAQQVKPLEFVLEEEVWKAHTELGCICIFGVHDRRWVLYFDDDQCNNQRFATKAAAIEAANADYRKWVLSCLVWGWG